MNGLLNRAGSSRVGFLCSSHPLSCDFSGSRRFQSSLVPVLNFDLSPQRCNAQEFWQYMSKLQLLRHQNVVRYTDFYAATRMLLKPLGCGKERAPPLIQGCHFLLLRYGVLPWQNTAGAPAGHLAFRHRGSWSRVKKYFKAALVSDCLHRTLRGTLTVDKSSSCLAARRPGLRGLEPSYQASRNLQLSLQQF